MKENQFSINKLLVCVGLSAALIYRICVISLGRPAIVRDAFAYNMTAQRLVASGVFDYSTSTTINKAQPNAFIMPGYVLFLAPFYIVGGVHNTPVQNAAALQIPIILIQIILAVACTLITTYANYRWKGQCGAIIAGILAVCYIPFGLNASITLTETLNLFL